MKVIITIPAYNEEKTISRVIKDVKNVMGKSGYNYSIIVVNDGSTDGTAQIVKKEGVKVFSHPTNQGLAETFRFEMEKCLEQNPDIIVHIDADSQYLARDIPKLIAEVSQGASLVLGSRFKGRIESMSLIKRIGNIAFSRTISKIIRQRITDAQTGLRAFTKDVATIPINSNHTYTQEQIIRVSKAKLSIKEVPIYFAKRGGKTNSRLMSNPFGYAIKAWINILRIYRDYEPLKFFGIIGGFFGILGLVLGIWIVINLLIYGRVGGIPRVILSALFIMTGVQIISFGFLADINRK